MTVLAMCGFCRAPLDSFGARTCDCRKSEMERVVIEAFGEERLGDESRSQAYRRGLRRAAARSRGEPS